MLMYSPWHPDDYQALATKRAKRCCSCSALIRVGELVRRFHCYKVPESEVECAIYGEDGEVPRANQYHCERCADISYSLEELGFCFSPWEDQPELLRTYQEVYGQGRQERAPKDE